jgi:hypothetical protein
MRVALLSTQDGYIVDGVARPGFADDADMSLRQRRRIAQWARKFGEITDEQLALLEREPATSSTAAKEAADLASVWRSPVFLHLSDGERARTVSPETVVSHGYPLSVSDVEQIVGCSARQIRHWDALGLLPARRNARNERLFGPAATMRAFWLFRRGQDAVTMLSRFTQPEAASELLAMAASILNEQAAGYGIPSATVTKLADEMETVSVRMVGAARKLDTAR